MSLTWTHASLTQPNVHCDGLYSPYQATVEMDYNSGAGTVGVNLQEVLDVKVYDPGQDYTWKWVITYLRDDGTVIDQNVTTRAVDLDVGSHFNVDFFQVDVPSETPATIASSGRLYYNLDENTCVYWEYNRQSV